MLFHKQYKDFKIYVREIDTITQFIETCVREHSIGPPRTIGISSTPTYCDWYDNNNNKKERKREFTNKIKATTPPDLRCRQHWPTRSLIFHCFQSAAMHGKWIDRDTSAPPQCTQDLPHSPPPPSTQGFGAVRAMTRTKTENKMMAVVVSYRRSVKYVPHFSNSFSKSEARLLQDPLLTLQCEIEFSNYEFG